eukprot:6202088-Pleurochrysis_carterae.AAC.2
MPDGQLSPRLAADAREEDLTLPGVRCGRGGEKGQEAWYVSHNAGDSTGRDSRSHPGQPAPANPAGCITDTHLVSQVSAGGDDRKDLQQVSVGAASPMHGQLEAHVDMRFAGGAWAHAAPGGLSNVRDGDRERLQIRPLHLHGGCVDDNASRFCHYCALSEEHAGLLLVHVRAGGQGSRGDSAAGEGAKGAANEAGRLGASPCCRATASQSSRNSPRRR